MDAVYQFLIDKAAKEPDPADPPDVRAVVAMTRRLAQTGEPWLSGIPENQEREYFALAGLHVVEVLPMGSAEAGKRYRTRRDGTIVGNQASFASVGCLIEATVRWPSECLWQLKMAHFGNLFWPTPGREPFRAVAFPS